MLTPDTNAQTITTAAAAATFEAVEVFSCQRWLCSRSHDVETFRIARPDGQASLPRSYFALVGMHLEGVQPASELNRLLPTEMPGPASNRSPLKHGDSLWSNIDNNSRATG